MCRKDRNEETKDSVAWKQSWEGNGTNAPLSKAAKDVRKTGKDLTRQDYFVIVGVAEYY
jgi:hypothetical protein